MNQASNPPRSDLERLNCRWEKFSDIIDEVWPLLKRQHAEVGVNKDAVPLDPDVARYLEYERAGILHNWCARTQRGQLVGFVNCFLTNSLLCRSVLYGFAEHFYLAPEWRDGSRGRRMLLSCKRALVDLGATAIRFNTNDLFEPDEHGRSRVGAIFKRDGFQPIVTIWEWVK